MSISLLFIFLITACLDSSDAKTTKSKALLFFAQLATMFLPALAGITLYALSIRIDQYGWTPQRLYATIITCFILAYAIVYIISVLFQRSRWRETIRNGNIYLALAVMAISIIVQTPILDVYRISSNNQLERYIDGRTPTAELPFRAMRYSWGNAGRAALSELQKYAKNDALL